MVARINKIIGDDLTVDSIEIEKISQKRRVLRQPPKTRLFFDSPLANRP